MQRSHDTAEEPEITAAPRAPQAYEMQVMVERNQDETTPLIRIRPVRVKTTLQCSKAEFICWTLCTNAVWWAILYGIYVSGFFPHLNTKNFIIVGMIGGPLASTLSFFSTRKAQEQAAATLPQHQLNTHSDSAHGRYEPIP